MRYNRTLMNWRHRRAHGASELEILESRRHLAAVAFGAPVTTNIITSLFNSSATAVGDLNNDGIPDLVVGNQDGSGQVLLGTNGGQFTPGPLIGPGAQVVAVADFNNDGNLDVATGLGVLPGNGDGTLGLTPPANAYTLPLNTVALDAADVNGDGNVDLIAVTLTQSSQNSAGSNLPQTLGVSVLLGNGNGSFKAPISTTLGTAAGLGQSFSSIALDDFNGDGKLDVLSAFGVSIGKGDGTFAAPIPFPQAPASTGSSGSTGSGASTGAPAALPSYWAMTVADFNGDGNLDVALLPPAGSPAGQVDVLLGKGDGSFGFGTPISLGASATITALGNADLNGDGQTDLIVGQTSSDGNTSFVDVLIGNGDGTFGPAASFALQGVPVGLSAADFNADGNLDLLAIQAATGSSLTQGILPATSVSVLLNSQTLSLTPTVALGTSAPRVVSGMSATFSAVVQPPAPSPVAPGTIPISANSPVPTGRITFMQGATTLGSVTLKNDRAKLTAAVTGVGTQQITAVYSGDVNYSSVTSAPINETVLLTSNTAPLLVPALSSVTAPALFVPRDAGSVTVTVTNGGGAIARGRVSIDLFLSPTQTIGASAIALTSAALQNRFVAIGIGRSTTLTGRFVFSSYPPGVYYLIAQVTPISGLTTDNLTASQLVNPGKLQAPGMVFGTVGTHQNLSLIVTDPSGNRARLSLSGGGYGSVTQANGLTDVTLTGTTTASKLFITPLRGATYSFDSIADSGALFSITAPRAIVTGSLSIGGSIGSISLAGAGDGGSMPMTLGSGATTSLSLGTVAGVDLNAAAPIRFLAASLWQGGQILAPSIQTIVVKGAFNPDVQTSGPATIQTAILSSIDGGTWAIPGGIAALRISGDLSDASIYAGANVGPDNVLGTIDDRYSVASIGSIFIGGSDTSSLIAAGAAPSPGGPITSGITLIPNASIARILVRGQVSTESRFLASILPPRALLTGAYVLTASDPRFQV
jgi:hypothetical protein